MNDKLIAMIQRVLEQLAAHEKEPQGHLFWLFDPETGNDVQLNGRPLELYGQNRGWCFYPDIDHRHNLKASAVEYMNERARRRAAEERSLIQRIQRLADSLQPELPEP